MQILLIALLNYDPASNLPSAYYSSVLPFNWERQGHSAAPQLLANGIPTY